MNTVEFRDQLCKILDQRIAQLTDSLAAGLASDYTAYRQICGQLEGLRLAKEAAQVVLRRLHKEDEE